MPAASVSNRHRTSPSGETRSAPWSGTGCDLKETQTGMHHHVARRPVTGAHPSGARRGAMSPVAPHDGYIIALPLSDAVPYELWVDGRRLAAPLSGEERVGEPN